MVRERKTMKLKAVILNCTLKPSPERSHTQALIDKVVQLMEPLGVERSGEGFSVQFRITALSFMVFLSLTICY